MADGWEKLLNSTDLHRVTFENNGEVWAWEGGSKGITQIPPDNKELIEALLSRCLCKWFDNIERLGDPENLQFMVWNKTLYYGIVEAVFYVRGKKYTYKCLQEECDQILQMLFHWFEIKMDLEKGRLCAVSGGEHISPTSVLSFSREWIQSKHTLSSGWTRVDLSKEKMMNFMRFFREDSDDCAFIDPLIVLGCDDRGIETTIGMIDDVFPSENLRKAFSAATGYNEFE